MQFEKICVIGLGYIGLPTAAMFAQKNLHVVGVDKNKSIVDKINRAKIHIVEPGLETLVESVVNNGSLVATTKPETADAYIIAVPTPFIKSSLLGGTPTPDISYIEDALKNVASVVNNHNLIILESTSPVGTTEHARLFIKSELEAQNRNVDIETLYFAYCPERVLPGNIIHELEFNDRIIGGLDSESAEAAKKLYSTFVKGGIHLSDAKTSEMVKLTENASRDVQIAFANELSMICSELEIDVWELIRLANKHPRVNILQPGPGVGGHCIAVDPWFVVSKSPASAKMIRTAREINDYKLMWTIGKIEELISRFLNENPTSKSEEICICLYGLSFKPDIDDLRESPALRIAKTLFGKYGNSILAIEPNIQEQKVSGISLISIGEAKYKADIAVLLVDHSEFKKQGKPNTPYLLDTRGVW